MRAKIKILKRVVNEHAGINETFLAPYVGYVATVFKYAGGKINLIIDGMLFENVQGDYWSEYNGWNYKVVDLLTNPQQ